MSASHGERPHRSVNSETIIQRLRQRQLLDESTPHGLEIKLPHRKRARWKKLREIEDIVDHGDGFFRVKFKGKRRYVLLGGFAIIAGLSVERWARHHKK
jgi:hypothetical protein